MPTPPSGTSARLRAPHLRLLAALLVVAGVLLAVSAPTRASAPGETPARTLTYEVRVKGEVRSDVAAFTRIAARTFNDRRGWSAGGAIRFRQVASGGDFTLWLAQASTMTSFSPSCSSLWSCRVGPDVIINDDRWRLGTESWPQVAEYRRYVLNHELGHWFGLGHTYCTTPGAAATVMQQQSKGLQGCRAQTWPLEPEREAAAEGIGVALRPEAPALYAVARAAGERTAVHVADGVRGWGSWLQHSASALGDTSGAEWAFALSDHDRDGVEDLYAVDMRGASGRTELYVLSGAGDYRTVLLHRATAFGAASPAEWTFLVADVDTDGYEDLVGVRAAASLATQVHVATGSSGFQTFGLRRPTPLVGAPTDRWSYGMGDADRDGRPDLFAVARAGASGSTEVHVLSGASGFSGWARRAATPLGPTPRRDWEFLVRDVDGDGRDEVAALKRSGSTGRTELHVLDATHQRWLLRVATVVPATGRGAWSFDLD